MRIIRPSIRNIVRVVGQPSFIESYERTSIYPKLTAYIEKWKVDIGDRVKKGDLLATLFVPEVVEDFGTKNATVKLDEERIDLARKLVEVAEADVQGAEARLVEAKAILGKYPGRGRSLGLAGQANSTRGRADRNRPADLARVDRPVEVEHCRAGCRQGNDLQGGSRFAFQKG